MRSRRPCVRILVGGLPGRVRYASDMSQDRLQLLVLQQLSLRIGSETAAYLARHLAHPAAALPLMGGDARTGTPRRLLLSAQQLAALQAAPPVLH